MDFTLEQRRHLHVRTAHRALRVANQGGNRMLARIARWRATQIVVGQAGAHRHARALRTQSQGHGPCQAIDGGFVTGLDHDIAVCHHILIGRGIADLGRDGIGDPIQDGRPAKAHVGAGAARRHRAADRHGGNLRIQTRRQVIWLGEGGQHHDVARRGQRRTHRAGIDRIEDLVDRECHARSHPAADRHRHVARQRRDAGHVARRNADIARRCRYRGIADLRMHRVLDRIDGKRAAHRHARAASQADRHVVDAGTFFGPDLHGFRLDRGRRNRRAHVVAHVRHAHRRADGRRCALRHRNAQRARRRHDAAGVLRRYRHRARFGQDLLAGRCTRVVDDGADVRPRDIHADSPRAAQGLAPGASHGDAQHAVGQGMALRQRTDVQ
ncbi:hypothetical protein LMG3431_02338 [Achromobacter pestifer]|uniref:Uncharacterized protein n=1 Tax=Achromobacter pestifer TaxID=1353889 RepID=A0A6S6YUF0_9BURK|nr:hypothetical protein LMG3431_02338 [Achromobacter pestifer]